MGNSKKCLQETFADGESGDLGICLLLCWSSYCDRSKNENLFSADHN